MAKKGFTLVEILVAVAMFCIVCTPVMGLILKSWQLNEYSTRIHNNSMYAQYLMESLKGENPDILAGLLRGGGRTALYSLYKEGSSMDMNPADYTLYKGQYRYCSDNIKPEESYRDIAGNFTSNADENGYNGVSRVVLSRDDDGVFFICVSVWDKTGKDEYKSTLVSMRR